MRNKLKQKFDQLKKRRIFEFSIYQNYEDQKIQRYLDAIEREECSICMHRLKGSDDPVPDSSDSFFQTPCNHKFHQKCLLGWLAKKLECPICRQALPPPDAEEEEYVSSDFFD